DCKCEECIKAHAGGKCNRISGIQSHDHTADKRGKGSSHENGAHIHLHGIRYAFHPLQGKDRRVDCKYVCHRQECRQTADDLPAVARSISFKIKIFFHEYLHSFIRITERLDNFNDVRVFSPEKPDHELPRERQKYFYQPAETKDDDHRTDEHRPAEQTTGNCCAKFHDIARHRQLHIEFFHQHKHQCIPRTRPEVRCDVECDTECHDKETKCKNQRVCEPSLHIGNEPVEYIYEHTDCKHIYIDADLRPAPHSNGSQQNDHSACNNRP